MTIPPRQPPPEPRPPLSPGHGLDAHRPLPHHRAHARVPAARSSVPEIAFVGRSNAGKSTCINTLTQQKRLAFASKTPGRTQSINLFALGKQGVTDAVLADLPGYGYAAVPKEDKIRWQQVMANYLVTRENLHGVVLLCDPRHGLTELDDILLEVIRPRVEQGLKFLLLLTKADKLNRSEAAKALSIARLQAGGGEVKLFSALKKQGVEETAAAALAVGASASETPTMIETFQQALPHGITLSCRAAGERGRPGADVPARLSGSRLRLGRTAGAFRAARERRLPLRRAQPARLRKLLAARRRQAVPRQIPGAGHRGADRDRRRAAGLPGRARLGRRGGLEPGQPVAAADEEAGDHQFAAPRHLPARPAVQTRSSRPPAPT